MSRTLYVAGAGAGTGKSAVALGLLTALRRRAGRIGVFRPLVRADEPDAVLRLLDPGGGGTCGTTYDAVHVDPDAAVRTIVDRFRAADAGYDAMLAVGTDFTDVGAATELSLNARIARELAAPVLLVISGQGCGVSETVDAVTVAVRSWRQAGCQVLGAVVNRVPAEDRAATRNALSGRAIPVAGVIPEDPLLSMPTVGQLFRATAAQLLWPSEDAVGGLDREVPSITVCAMTLPNVLDHLTEGTLVITPGDRADVVVGAVLAHQSQAFPRLSGLLLTGGMHLDPPVHRLVDGLGAVPPIARTQLNTFEAATRADRTRGALTDATGGKLERAVTLFAEHVDTAGLLDRLDLHRSDSVTPLMFADRLEARARAERRRIVLPEGTEARVLSAAAQALSRGIADIVLLGPPDAVRSAAAAIGADIAGAEIVDPHDPTLRTRLAEEYVLARAHRGMVFEVAYDRVVDPAYCGTLMVRLGLADGMVAGAATTTAHTVRPALEVIGTVPGTAVVSSVFFMCLPDRVLVYGDCAINPSPTAAQLADIAVSSARSAAAFGVEPRVAMLSYSTGESGHGSAVDTVREAVQMVRAAAPDLPVEGPIQYDAAIDVGVARTKLPGSGVAGRATVFVFPDLNTGNTTYKAVQRSAGAIAVGPVLQGLRKPVNDLSRGATVADIVTTIAITAVQAGRG